jgi:sialate O-acetylesterase
MGWTRDEVRNFSPESVHPPPPGLAPLRAYLGSESGWAAPDEDFSAVCCHAALEMATAHTDVPIGLLAESVGGTSIRLWTDVEDLEMCQFADDPDGSTSGGLYTKRILPLAPFMIRGIFWYQGEADVANRHMAEYECAFPRLVQRWRSIFHAPDAFFAFVRLSTWCETTANARALPMMRDAQMSALMLPRVGYVPAEDLGDPSPCTNTYDGGVHPPDKRSVGKRLARVALALGDFGEEVPWRAPEVEAVEVLDDAVCVRARHVASHLYVREHTPSCDTACFFSHELNDWRPAEMFVRDGSICFRADASEGVSFLRYGWASMPLLAVYDNATELPLLPFEHALI